MQKDVATPIPVYAFGPAWDMPVPCPSPFGLKLITWLRLHHIPFELHVENNPGKGPKQKSPWVVVDGEVIGDSELVVQRLKKRHGIEEPRLGPEQRAIAHATRRMLEEHYHQVWEHELFIHEGGWERGKEFFDQLPPGVRVLVRALVRSSLKKQLVARGVGRHGHDEIVAMGIADLDAIDALLGDKTYFLGDEPTDIDATVFAFMAVTRWTPVRSPVWDHFHANERLTSYCDRMLARCFPAHHADRTP